LKYYIEHAIKFYWYKYCGIYDEYRTLKNKWTFLSEKYHPVLPKIDCTFEAIERMRHVLDQLFALLGYKRSNEKNVKFDDIKNQAYLDYIDIIKKDLRALGILVGYLKLAFFQRTVSSEIPQLEAALPRSPERTLGNEFFYLAADKIAASYEKCLKLREIKWDGFVTFIPPVGDDKSPAYELTVDNLVHLNFSDEEKYFIGTYNIIAHELGHAVLQDKYNIYYSIICTIDEALREKNTIEIKQEELLEIFNKKNRSLVSELEDNNFKERFCKHCSYSYQLIQYWNNKDRNPIEEILADIIAFKIGGFYTIKSLYDATIGLIYDLVTISYDNIVPIIQMKLKENILRLSAFCGYLEGINPSSNHIREIYENMFICQEQTISEITEKIEEIRDKIDPLEYKKALTHSKLRDECCIPCIQFIGGQIGKIISTLDKDYNIFSYLIYDDKVFSPNEDVVEEIKSKLCKGIPVNDAEPRLILHAYYEGLSENAHPSFSATLHSIVFNDNI